MSRSTLANVCSKDAAQTSEESGSGWMRILVLPRPGVEPIFYYEPRLKDEDQDGDADPGRSSRSSGGVRARFDRLLTWIRDAEHHAPAWLRSPISWLKTKLPADERLLMALRKARAVCLVHPSGLPDGEVRRDWHEYLENRLRFRIFWLVLDIVILVPSIVISVLPGPNVVGLWISFRVIAHAVALVGISRAMRGRVGISTQPSELLDGPVILSRRETDRVQEHFNLLGLKGRLKRERVIARLRHRQGRTAAAPRGEEAWR